MTIHFWVWAFFVIWTFWIVAGWLRVPRPTPGPGGPPQGPPVNWGVGGAIVFWLLILAICWAAAGPIWTALVR